MTRQQRLTLLCFLLPIAVLVIWTLRLHVQRAHGVVIEVPIKGYDPRDLLAGHYLRFHLDLGRQDPCLRPGEKPKADPAPRCLCLQGKGLTIEWQGVCEEKPASCELYIQGRCDWSGFTAGVERFYIPEKDSQWIPRLPEGSRLLLSVQANGSALPIELKPAGKSYQEYIDEKRQGR
jgi:hypothetical protein